MARSWLDSVQERVPTDYNYSSLLEKRSMFTRGGPNRSRLLLPFAGLVAVVIIFFTFSGHEATQNATSYISHSISGKTSKVGFKPVKTGLKHILSPADKGNSDVCKFVLSAAINNYETVTLYNWHNTGDKMAKISGGLRYMESLDSSHDDELLLIADGFDEWFQLPPQLMESRFHEINRRENERILTRTGKPYKQNIIISTQRQCWPGDSTDIMCYAAPESPLPGYVFGHETDNMPDGYNTYSHLRSRYMNAGYTMGTVKAMRELWARAQERSVLNPTITGLDQNILATIWGEQNYMREYERFSGEPLESGYGAEAVRHEKRDWPPWDAQNKRKSFKPVNGTNYEFGIGLDYGSELSLPTVFAEYDAEWLTFSNQSTLDEAFKAQEVTRPGATRLQKDIAALPPPFSAFNGLSAGKTWDKEETNALADLHGMAKNLTWNDTALFTNMYTGITPVIIHHNAWRDNLKSRRESTWEFMWFQPYLRQLADAYVANLPKPNPLKNRMSAKFARLTRRIAGKGKDSKAAVEDQPPVRGLGAKTDNDDEGNWVSWHKLCDEKAQKEVFRDDKGPWVGLGGAGKQKEQKEGLYPAHKEPGR